MKIVLGTLGMKEYRVRVGLRDPDSPNMSASRRNGKRPRRPAAKRPPSTGRAVYSEPGEAAFYGPKIDFVVKDVIGREWQLGTVQVDYQLPQRFELSYTGSDNKAHRPVMIHRAPFRIMERFIGVLIEHFGGAFPLWLAPVQVAVLSISEKFNAYANEVVQALEEAGLRVEAHLGADKIGAKIRQATMQKIPYMLIVGEKEVAGSWWPSGHAQGPIWVRCRSMEFIERCQQEIALRVCGPRGRWAVKIEPGFHLKKRVSIADNYLVKCLISR